MNDVPENEWITACARRLQQHWQTVELLDLEALAAELSHDGHLRGMPPAEAAVEWLRPVTQSHVAA